MERDGPIGTRLRHVEIVRSGTWLYDGTAPRPVDIVALEFDFWYEIGRSDGHLEHGETPQPLGPDGCLYYVRFQHAGDSTTPTWVDGSGYASLAEAVEAAEASAPGPIRWHL